MKKQKKRTLRPYELWNPGAVEQWLEDEAAKGWRLTDCGARLARFERTKPSVCRVRVHPQEPEAREDFLERIAAYEEMSWKYVAAVETDFEIFYCDDPAAPELFTDTMSYGWAWEKQLKRARRSQVLILLAVLAAMGYLTWIGLQIEEPVDFFLESGILFLLLSVLLLWHLVNAARQLVVMHRVRRQLEAGVALGHTGDWRKMRSRANLLYAFFVGVMLLNVLVNPLQTLAGQWWKGFDELEEPAPYVTAETLDLAKPEVLRDGGYVHWEWQPLAPDRYDVMERYPNQ